MTEETEPRLSLDCFLESTKDKQINIQAMAKRLGVSTPRLWYYIRGKRKSKMSADLWIHLMIATGNVDKREGVYSVRVPENTSLDRAWSLWRSAYSCDATKRRITNKWQKIEKKLLEKYGPNNIW